MQNFPLLFQKMNSNSSNQIDAYGSTNPSSKNGVHQSKNENPQEINSTYPFLFHM